MVVIVLFLRAKKLFDKTPQLIIDHTGIVIKNEDKISWQKIKYIHIRKNDWKSLLQFWKRKYLWGNSVIFGLSNSERDVKLHVNFLDTSVDELEKLIKQHYFKYGNHKMTTSQAVSKQKRRTS